jgi:hypothetical protein
MDALERSQARNAELERENGMLSERVEAVRQLSDEIRERLEIERDAAHAELEAASILAAEPPEPSSEPQSALDPFPAPLQPTPNGLPWWRRWLAAVYG